ncbi:Hpt domain-containing protein [Pedobacter mendelii]|uniref:HPt domain-containing protein n=1 Tax=Pedobacter mendelii TaxID=1908240 RepID=A0ABQ2BDK0_9SPHI|nr:Hpt domain-containing protein [Pedobacter mendelii]GGI23461.1 hypothetical protein GCM10008119_07760 [Pedobacter mendelii]
MQDNRDNHPLDLSYLKEMAGHDPEFMIEVFEIFIEQTPFYMAELENALSIKDWKKVADFAHKIKPTFAYIGRGDVKDFVDYIETSSKSEENLDLIPKKVITLQLLLDKIYLQIDGAIKELRP